jgi:hypothetical protein
MKMLEVTSIMDKDITEFLSDVPIGTLPRGSTSTVVSVVASSTTSMTMSVINANPWSSSAKSPQVA